MSKRNFVDEFALHAPLAAPPPTRYERLFIHLYDGCMVSDRGLDVYVPSVGSNFWLLFILAIRLSTAQLWHSV